MEKNEIEEKIKKLREYLDAKPEPVRYRSVTERLAKIDAHWFEYEGVEFYLERALPVDLGNLAPQRLGFGVQLLPDQCRFSVLAEKILHLALDARDGPT